MIELPPAIDITIEMGNDMLAYPGDALPVVRRLSSIQDGAALTASEVVLGCHLGTHVDAPAHFIGDALTVDALELRHFCGRASVLEMPDRDRVTADDLSGTFVVPGRHILVKTRNSELLHRRHFDPNYCYLTLDAAERLLEFQPLSVGFDYYSFDPPSEIQFPAHRIIASHGIPAFLCLDLKNVIPGEYTFVALPLKLPGVEALPVRAVLFSLPGE